MPTRKPTTPFSPPAQVVRQQAQQQPVPQVPEGAFVHPSVATDPAALAYAIGARARLQERKQGTPLQKYTQERPGPSPAMPPLEAQHHAGMTMEQQAGMYGPRPEAVAQRTQSDSIVDNGPQFHIGSTDPSAPKSPPTPQQMGIMPGDMLPEEAMKDPKFLQGPGSLIAANQPHMAMKYGVVRNGIRVPAQALQANIGQAPGQRRPGARPIQDTLRDLSTIASAQPPTELPRDEAEADRQSASSPSAASQNAGKPLSASEKKEQDKEIEEAIEKLDDFDYDSLRRQMNRDEINNPRQREIIEERLRPMDVTELITKDRVRQEIPIIPGKFWVLFQSTTGEDDLELKRLLMQESKSVEVSERYLLDKYAIMTLTAGCIAINSNPCPDHLDDKGNFDEKKFWLKFAWMLKRGIHVLASIGANHTWFEMRVRRLLVAEKVKNG